MNEKMTLDDVGLMVKRIILKNPFYGMFLMSLEKEISSEIPLMAIGLNKFNYKLFINLEKMNELPAEERLGVMMHELYHICHNHLLMNKEFPDHNKSNIAFDLFINDLLSKQGYSLPKFGLFPEKFNFPKGLSSKEYYNLLTKEDDAGDPNSMTKKMLDAMRSGKKGNFSHDWSEFEEIDEEMAEIIKNQTDHQIKNVVEACRAQGHNVPAELSDYVKGLYKIYKPSYDWKRLTRQFFQGSIDRFRISTKKRVNKRFDDVKGRKYKEKPSCILYLDGSGSMRAKDFELAFSEINHVYKQIAVDICHFDYHVDTPYRYRGEKELPKSNGGTNFSHVREHFNEQRDYSFGIILTDGYAEQVDKFNKPLLWLITTKNGFEECKSQPGIKILMKDEEK